MIKRNLFVFASALTIVGSAAPVQAESLHGVLTAVYQNNPQLNAARAGLRATDESLPQARAGKRPTASLSNRTTLSTAKTNAFSSTAGSRGTTTTNSFANSLGITLSQTLYDGGATNNSIYEAKANIQAARFNLMNTEQTILLSAVEAYVNVLGDRSVLTLRRRNLEFVEEQLKAARQRFEVGEATRIDTAQAESSRGAALAQVNAAEASLKASRALFRQIVGHEAKSLRPASVPAKLLPRSIDGAVNRSLGQHPRVRYAVSIADAAAYAVKVAEAAFKPHVSISGSASRSYTDKNPWNKTSWATSNEASISGTISMPLLSGGGALSSRVRQAKQIAGQRLIEVDLTRSEIRATVISAWGQYEAAGATIYANQIQRQAAQIALDGTLEEFRVGQKTTLDVLNAQQDLLDARVSLINAERDRVVTAYNLLSAMGKLTASSIGLAVETYDVNEHYNQVKDKWFGLRTPDGR